MAPGLQSIAVYSGLAMARGAGCTLIDEDGNRYLDFMAGIGVGSIGHTHPHYVEAMKGQLERLTFGSFTTENRARFLELLASVTPGQLKRTQMYSGGAEAVEAAFRLAKSATGKFEFVGFWGGFHGKTGGVLGLLGDDFKKRLGPFMPGLYSAPYAYCYRCPLQLRYPGCGIACVELLRQVIHHQSQGEIAAIIVEPIQGTAGNVVPPPGFLSAVQAVARECDALLIADEMLTGFGRTGKMWGCDHEPLVPDVIAVGKGMGGGFPVSGVISTQELMASKPFGNPSGSSSSYGGNPLAATAGLATLEVILKERLVTNARRVGAVMLKRLEAIKEKYPFVGDVRGRGLLIGIELVKDRKTKEPLPKPLTRKLFASCLQRGLLAMCYSYNIRINPPLTITEEQALEGLAILEEAFAELSRGKGSKFQVPSSKLKKGSKFQVPSSKLEDGLTFHKPGTGNSEPRTAKQNLEPGTRNLQR
jgi:4-aminobutyrate aminotransferase-like enzyme